MQQTENTNRQIIALYFIASALLIYTFFKVYLEYTVPFAATAGPNFEGLASARSYQLIGNLLFISSFLVPGAYYAWRNKEFRVKFAGMEIFHLLVINLMVLK